MDGLGALFARGTQPCPVCGEKCKGFHLNAHPETYPFLPGGYDPMENQEFVIAPHAIEDPELERNVYGVGDKVPMADAIKYGLVEKTSPRKSKAAPTEDRARKPAANRKK